MSLAIMSNGEIRSAISEIKGLACGLHSQIHQVSVSCLAHIRDHGDWTLMSALLAALPNSARVKALAYWTGHFSNGKAIFSRDKQTQEWKCNLSKDRTADDFDIVGAEQTHFADLTAEKDPKSLTAEALEKYLTKVANNSDYFPGTTIRKVEDAANTLAALAVKTIRAKKSEIAQQLAA